MGWAEKFIGRLEGMSKNLFFHYEWDHDDTAQYKFFWVASGLCKMTLFEIILKFDLHKMLKISGLTAGYTYNSIQYHILYI